MELVVDASVAVKWLIPETGADAARQLLRSNVELHAPRLLIAEVASALWRRARLGEIQTGHAGEMMEVMSTLPVHWRRDETLGADAVRLGIALDRPVYDCVYLALAHQLRGRVITADRRFANAVALTEHGGAVVTLEDYAAGQFG